MSGCLFSVVRAVLSGPVYVTGLTTKIVLL